MAVRRLPAFLAVTLTVAPVPAAVLPLLMASAMPWTANTAYAQERLPEISVTSPIVRRLDMVPGEADLTGLPVHETYVPVTVVNAAELARSTGATLGDVLFSKPGITGSTFAPGASRPIIRGLDNFRVRIQEGGIASMDVSDLGEDHAVPIDPLAATQIEVVRGPATLRYGSQAIGGVVNVTNNRIPDTVVPGVRVETKAAVTSVDKGREAAVLLDAGHGNVAMHMDAFSRAAEDYRTPNGTQLNSALRTEGQAVGGSYVFNGGFVGLALTHQTSLYHIPGTESAAGNTRIDLEQTKLLSKGEVRPSSAAIEAIRFWLGASDYKHNELGLGGDGTDGVRATFKNQEQEARVEMQSMPFDTRFGQLTSAVGAQFGNQRLGTEGDAGSLLAPSRTRSAAAYLFNELSVTDTLRLQAAGRIETVSVAGTAATFPGDLLGLGAMEPDLFTNSRRFTPTSASLGVLQDLPFGLTASLTGQYVERAPKAIELYAKGPHDASGTFEIGDAALNKEAATTFEAGLRRRVGRLRFEANVYHTRYAGFIFKRVTGVGCGDEFATCGEPGENALTQVIYSQRDAHFTGGELAAQFDVAPVASGMFGVDGQYDIVRARFADGSAVPRMPPQRLGGGVWWRSDAWFARVGLLHAFAQNNLAANETPTDGYNLLKAELSYTYKQAVTPFGPQEITIGLVGDNLLDDDVRNSVSFRKDEVLQPGRGVKLFANVKF
ncbi:MAG: hypothetical protein JWN71_570 [Xanthobacteraceae bacterium]|nr:hypothetical protein [Xanthobacteraceae bacterium]